MTVTLDADLAELVEQVTERTGLVGNVPKVRFLLLLNLLEERANSDAHHPEARAAYREALTVLIELLRYDTGCVRY